MARKLVSLSTHGKGAQCTLTKCLLLSMKGIVEISANKIWGGGCLALGASAGRDQKTYSAHTNLRIKAFFHIGVSGLVQELSYCIQALKFHSVVSRMRINLAKISQLTLSSRLFQFSPRQSYSLFVL